jgi:hypothetical protein
MNYFMGSVCVFNMIVFSAFAIKGGPFAEGFTMGCCGLIALNSFVRALECFTDTK